jgi:hypothetical protein
MINPMNLQLPSEMHSTKRVALALVFVLALGVVAYAAFPRNVQESTQDIEANASTTVAWYVAHIADAKDINRTCFKGEDPLLTQDSQPCQNALKALNMAHISQNYQN